RVNGVFFTSVLPGLCAMLNLRALQAQEVLPKLSINLQRSRQHERPMRRLVFIIALCKHRFSLCLGRFVCYIGCMWI
ncbi:MAG: hypothetical protein AAB403_23960, partial [Planctomycetota bacterium]